MCSKCLQNVCGTFIHARRLSVEIEQKANSAVIILVHAVPSSTLTDAKASMPAAQGQCQLKTSSPVGFPQHCGLQGLQAILLFTQPL